MERELPVRLSPEEIQQRGETIAAKMVHVKALRKKRREDLRSINAQIEAELDTVQTIAETIMNGVEARKQGDLRFGDEVVPSAGEATAALAEVAKLVLWHRDGAVCRKEVCKRRHLTAEQLDKAGIVREGQSIAPEGDEQPADGPPKCVGCATELTAMEIVKKLGLCEACQVAKPSDAEIEAIGEQLDHAPTGTDQTPAEEIAEDDPRPRCSTCRSVLDADEVEKGIGICQGCINDNMAEGDLATGYAEAPAEEAEEA